MTSSGRFKLCEIAPGGILLDLLVGNVVQLNETATFVWQLHLSGGSVDEIAAALVNRYGIEASVGRRDVTAALAIDQLATVSAAPPEFSYRRSEQGYLFSRLDQALFLVDEGGESLTLAPAARQDAQMVPFYLQGIAPKLLALRGHAVLHASAVAIGTAALALAGASGAGKTTTARAMVRAGASAVCEDKLLVRVSNGEVRCSLGAESTIARWTTNMAEQLATDGRASCHGLDAVAAGPDVHLQELGFLDSLRRGAPTARHLSPNSVAGAVLHHSFWGSDVADKWAEQLDVSIAMGRAVPGFEMTAAEGIPALEAEARSWVERGTFRAP
jgi:hypothetical protein